MKNRLAAAALLLPFLASAGQEPAETGPAVLRSVSVVGASASAGFHGAGEECAPIAAILEHALAAPHEAPRDHGQTFFFMTSMDGRAEMIREAADGASLLVGIDLLFWYAYGTVAEEADRLERLDVALAVLGGLDCPLLVGDLPDVSHATDGPMMSERYVPEPETLVALNERLAAWAAEREDVVVVPLARFVQLAVARETIELRGQRWEGERIDALFQKDLLHPTLEGTAGMVVLALDALERARDDVEDEHLVFEVDALVEAVREASEPDAEPSTR